MTPRTLPLVWTLAALCACTTVQPTPTPVAAPKPLPSALERVRPLSKRAEALLKSQDEQVWKSWTEGAPLDIAKTYAQAPGLFSEENISALNQARAAAKDGREIRALTHLHIHFVGEYLAAALADVNDAAANLEASVTFNAGGTEYPYRDLERLLANEPSAAKRAALYEAATPAVVRISHALKRKEDLIEVALRRAGYPSYETYGSELRQADFEALKKLAEQVLDATRQPFDKLLTQLAEREGTTRANLRRSDFPRLFRPAALDSSFPKDHLVERVAAVVEGLGIDLGSLKNLKVDDRDSPHKNGRPLALPVAVPADVRLSLKPQPGLRAQAVAFHELGHALFFTYSQEPSFELGKLGNATVGEAFGDLFEDLLEDPLWMTEQTGLAEDKLERYLATQSARKLYLVRRTAAELLYSIAVHRATEQDPGVVCRVAMARALLIQPSPSDEERCWVDREDFYESADALRAWFIAGQLQAQLKTRFGASWWRSPKATAYLKSLWARGNGVNAVELAHLAGETAIKADALLMRLGSRLKLPFSLATRGP